MGTIATSAVVFVCLFGASLLGMLLRNILPEHHLSSETKDTVKVSMGLIATMAALVLGLLIGAAKDTYDKQAAGVTQMAAKAIYLDRMLANFGPETKDLRALYKQGVQRVISRMWPGKNAQQADLDPRAAQTETLFTEIQKLAPKNDLQTVLKSQATSTALDLGQMRWLEYEQAKSAISIPLLCILTFWLGILFISFGMFAPSNATVFVALLMAALAVAGAIFLMMELNSPFSGILQISSAPFENVLMHIGQ